LHCRHFFHVIIFFFFFEAFDDAAITFRLRLFFRVITPRRHYATCRHFFAFADIFISLFSMSCRYCRFIDAHFSLIFAISRQRLHSTLITDYADYFAPYAAAITDAMLPRAVLMAMRH
jgi:hypothetical protein